MRQLRGSAARCRPLGLGLCALALCALVLGLGCGGDDSAAATSAMTRSAQPAAARCELPSGGYSAECNVCLAARCCEPLEACKADPACAEQLGCEVQCQNDADPGGCTERCFAAGPQLQYSPYDDCSFADCRSSCWT